MILTEDVFLVLHYHVQIYDFGFQDDNDELRRSPGTPVFTAPECCLGQDSLPKECDAVVEIINKTWEM